MTTLYQTKILNPQVGGPASYLKSMWCNLKVNFFIQTKNLRGPTPKISVLFALFDFRLKHFPDIRILLTVNFEEDNTTDSVFVSEI